MNLIKFNSIYKYQSDKEKYDTSLDIWGNPRVDAKYINEYNWIDNIRRISNESELNSTSLEDINWAI